MSDFGKKKKSGQTVKRVRSFGPLWRSGLISSSKWSIEMSSLFFRCDQCNTTLHLSYQIKLSDHLFIHKLCQRPKCHSTTKSHASGRHWISQCVRIVAPIPKKTKNQAHTKKSWVTSHVSHVMCHMSCVTCHMSFFACNVSCDVCHLSHVTNANSHSHRPSLC